MSDLQTRLDPHRRADIRQMLVEQATPPPAPALTRGRRLALAGGLAAVVTATGVAVVTAFPGPPPANYGAWTAEPQAAPPLTAPPQDLEEWASKCSDLGVGGVAVGGVPARPEAAARRQVLVDRRGGFTYCVDVAIGSGTDSDPLIALSGLKAGGRNGLNSMEATVSDKPFDPPQPGGVLVLGGGRDLPAAGDDTESIQIIQMYGLSGPDVTAVDLRLANGLRIAATLRAGIWGLWWPTDRGPAAGCRLEIHTASGTQTLNPEKVRLPI
jgi:hypothetical protein